MGVVCDHYRSLPLSGGGVMFVVAAVPGVYLLQPVYIWVPRGPWESPGGTGLTILTTAATASPAATDRRRLTTTTTTNVFLFLFFFFFTIRRIHDDGGNKWRAVDFSAVARPASPHTHTDHIASWPRPGSSGFIPKTNTMGTNKFHSFSSSSAYTPFVSRFFFFRQSL